MTVCIGALCDVDNKYICVADMLISTADVTSAIDSHISKISFLTHPDNYPPISILAFAGNVPQEYSVYAKMCAELKSSKFIVDDVKRALENSYRSARDEYINGYLSRYGLDKESFYAKGRKMFGKQRFFEIAGVLDQLWNIAFLVGGFAAEYPGAEGFIFTISDASNAEAQHRPGFAAIGIGNLAAETILFKTFKGALSAPEMTARLLEAKFLAEGPTVGKKTVVLSISPKVGTRSVSVTDIESVRGLWEQHGQAYLKEAASHLAKLI